MQLNFEGLDFSRSKIVKPSLNCAVEEPVVGKVAIYGAGLTLEDHLNDETPDLQIVSDGPEVAGEVKHLVDTCYKKGTDASQEASAMNTEVAEANELGSPDQALHDPCNLLSSVFAVSPSDHEPELEGADADNEALGKTRGGEKRESEDEFTSSILSNSVNSQVYTAIYGGHIVSESIKEQGPYVYGGQNFLVDLDILGDLLKASSCTESEENPSKEEKKRLEDLHLLKSITNSLGSIIWRNAMIALTYASSTPLDGPTGLPFSYEDLVAQRSSVIRQCISLAIGDTHEMNPCLMPPVFLIENHLSEKNELGCAVLPNGQCWRTELLILSYSLKILSEALPLSKPQESLDLRKIHGFGVQSFALLVVFFIAISHSPKTFR
ncbi:uncharacterized protein LOC115726324 isoform X3 [Rhodamnia argentea]|uniref:Uncharacterized protein LOC115726324 isoform X3 n=1 Tax=Rhodamnia argentea TaxID=178133 RepID=A0ABM3HHQ5_9MYRT|nr:uncharacterized protein LOC115726324 isoform X3 [Rhodamnia argentea]